MQLRMSVTTGVQTYSLHSYEIQLGTIYNSSYILGNRQWIGMTSLHLSSDKLKSLIEFMAKHEVIGSVYCWMYSVEWKKRGLPHALIWLYDKITSNEIDDLMC